jgi:hypothetical protein
VSGYDIALLVTGVVFLGLFSVNTCSMILSLRALEGDGRRSPSAAEAARTLAADKGRDLGAAAAIKKSAAY